MIEGLMWLFLVEAQKSWTAPELEAMAALEKVELPLDSSVETTKEEFHGLHWLIFGLLAQMLSLIRRSLPATGFVISETYHLGLLPRSRCQVPTYPIDARGEIRMAGVQQMPAKTFFSLSITLTLASFGLNQGDIAIPWNLSIMDDRASCI
ncbi:hypothetical protein SAY86_022109 [Trapa natans]|uniref:Uncharacterized protein n=1 Tax=Trapa natans TaxID=22666 RepID=A0AAN7MLQ6_TRANT|nr:hypothetical protein SAY86_022109 [Trapa natans]